MLGWKRWVVEYRTRLALCAEATSQVVGKFWCDEDVALAWWYIWARSSVKDEHWLGPLNPSTELFSVSLGVGCNCHFSTKISFLGPTLHVKHPVKLWSLYVSKPCDGSNWPPIGNHILRNLWSHDRCHLSQMTTVLTLIPATGGGGEMTAQCGFCRKSHSKQWNETAVFVTLLQTHWAFWCNCVYHYIYFRFYVAGLGVTSTWLVLRLTASYACDAKIYT